MYGVKSAFRIAMGFTLVLSLYPLISVATMASNMSSIGVEYPAGELMLGACTVFLSVAVTWLPAEVLFDLHSKVTGGGCKSTRKSSKKTSQDRIG